MQLLLVEDDGALARLMAESVALKRPDWEIVVAGDGAGALQVLQERGFDILVSDIEMPVMDGIALLERLRADPRHAGLPVILASGRDTRDQVREGMCSGADDYLVKPYTSGELIQAVESRLRRLQSLPSTPEPQEDAHQQALGQLTERERDVLALIGKGLVTKEIASKLDLSPNTVGVHRVNIMRKLDLHTSSALAALAVRGKLC